MTVLGSNPKARVNALHPEEFGICDLCGTLRNLVDLPFQFEWRGNQLQNTYMRRCYDTCLDVPFELNRPRILPPDPQPVMWARPPQWALQESENEGPNPYIDGPQAGSVQQMFPPDDVP
jgi:hypothetical protein